MHQWISKRVCGVYEIRNVATQKFYIGGSVDIYSRWRLHLHELRHKKHQNRRLQNSFNKHGENLFAFKIIETCEPIKVTEREQFYLDYHKPYLYGYNLAMGANRVMIGFKHSAESRAKLSASLKAKWATTPHPAKGRKLSDEQKAFLSNYFTGFKHTEEAKRKIGEASLSRGTFSPNHIANMSAAQKGHPVSEKQREDIRKALTGRKASPESIAKRSASMKKIIQEARDRNGGVVPWLIKSRENKKRNKEMGNVLSK